MIPPTRLYNVNGSKEESGDKAGCLIAYSELAAKEQGKDSYHYIIAEPFAQVAKCGLQ